MVKYTVKIYPQAIRELDDIYQYIASDKQSPGNGKAQLDRIKGALIIQTKCAFVCIWFCWILIQLIMRECEKWSNINVELLT